MKTICALCLTWVSREECLKCKYLFVAVFLSLSLSSFYHSDHAIDIDLHAICDMHVRTKLTILQDTALIIFYTFAILNQHTKQYFSWKSIPFLLKWHKQILNQKYIHNSVHNNKKKVNSILFSLSDPFYDLVFFLIKAQTYCLPENNMAQNKDSLPRQFVLNKQNNACLEPSIWSTSAAFQKE